MKKTLIHIIVFTFAILIGSSAILTNIAKYSIVQNEKGQNKTILPTGDTELPVLDILSNGLHNMMFVKHEQPTHPSFKPTQSVVFITKPNNLAINTGFFTAYKNSTQDTIRLFSQLHSEGHYLYSLCKMLI